MKKFLFSIFFLSLVHRCVFAGEGMWLPMLLASLNEKEMQSMGMKMSAEDIYSVNKGSLKDAIVQFGGGCTSEIISPQGLLLTNHHCGFGQIQTHTTLENNYIDNGFWAMSRKDELPNKGLTATLISRIEDVTAAALKGITEGMDKKARQSAIDKNLEEIKKTALKEPWEEVMIRPFYNGNQYFMFVTVTYRDVRLVGAPPSSIGKFGADTDNWVWPRHTGDFALFRIYADKNNHPADYAADNVPYAPKHYLPISLDGVTENDFTLVFGFPGRTNEYLPASAIRQIMDVTDPARIEVRDQTLALWDAAMRSDPQVKIQYASKQAGQANAWKKWKGEVLGLRSTNAVQEKLDFENEFMKVVALNAAYSKYGTLMKEFEELYKNIEPYAGVSAYYSEVTGGGNCELFAAYNRFAKLTSALQNNGEEGYQKEKKNMEGWLDGSFFKNYSAPLDQKVFAALLQLMSKKVDKAYLPEQLGNMLGEVNGDFSLLAQRIFEKTLLNKPEQAKTLLAKSSAEVAQTLQNDPAFQLAKAFADTFNQKVSGKYNEYNDRITELQQQYMAALLEVFPNRKLYPDANGTMRVTYGKVQGYRPRDAVAFASRTDLDGVMEKYVPGDYEFDVPAKLRELHQNKDYGVYGEKGRMPVAFIGSNHTTGGNSGSPAIDAHGNLIGLNFDRVWEGTMSDYNYDASICRNIMVDIRYVLFIVDKFAGAGHLVKEMTLVHPKMKDGPRAAPPGPRTGPRSKEPPRSAAPGSKVDPKSKEKKKAPKGAREPAKE